MPSISFMGMTTSTPYGFPSTFASMKVSASSSSSGFV